MKGNPGVQSSVNWQMQVWWTGQVSFGYDNGAWYDSPWSEGRVQVEQWNHLAITFHDRIVKTYFNAQLDSAFPYTMDADLNTEYTSSLIIGTGLGEEHFWGIVDQVKIYSYALSSEEIEAEFESGFARGDANGDRVIDVADVMYLINYLFIGGSAPNPMWVGDCNSDGEVDAADVIYLINYLFIGGSPPCAKREGPLAKVKPASPQLEQKQKMH